MSDDNPYEVPSESYGDRSGPEAQGAAVEVSDRTLEVLSQTRPWVQLMAVLLWIGTVLLIFAGLALVVMSLFAGEAGMVLIGAMYLILVLVYGSMARFLTKYASEINALRASESVLHLEGALDAQRKFWRLIGIVTLVVIGFYILMLAMMFAGIAFLDSPFFIGR